MGNPAIVHLFANNNFFTLKYFGLKRSYKEQKNKHG